jgi:hypothetical protein
LSTEKPPHRSVTILSPTIGKAVKKLVITVAAQKLICPHTRTYPKKAVAIIKIRITTPSVQTKPRGSIYEP